MRASLWSAAWFFGLAGSQHGPVYPEDESCATQSDVGYFDAALQRCAECSSLDERAVAASPGSSTAGTQGANSCVCPLGLVQCHSGETCSVRYSNDAPTDERAVVAERHLECHDCPLAPSLERMAPMRHRRSCLPCFRGSEGDASSTLGYSEQTGDCLCPAGYALVEQDEDGTTLSAKRCVRCAEGYLPGPEGVNSSVYDCGPCKDASRVRLASTGECVCRTGSGQDDAGGSYVAAGGACVPAEDVERVQAQFPVASAAELAFRDLIGGVEHMWVAGPFGFALGIQSSGASTRKVMDLDAAIGDVVWVRSAAIQWLYLRCGVQCMRGNTTACQCASNLCVLALYEERAEVCQFLREELYRGRGSVSSSAPGHKEGTPWIYYAPEAATQTLGDTSVGWKFTLGDVAETDDAFSLELWLAQYNLEGEWLGWKRLQSQLELCASLGGVYSSAAEGSSQISWRRFGSSLVTRCRVRLSSLLECGRTPIFYDLFVENIDGSLVPVPVRILNVVVGEDRPNLDQDSEDDVLVRRFLLCDAMTGREGDEEAYFYPGHQPIVFRWAAHIALQVKVRPDTEAQIFVPVLSIAYAEKRTSELQEGDETTVSFKAEYSMGTMAFWILAGVLLVLALVIACGCAGFKLYVLAARFPGIPAPYVGETAKALFAPKSVVQALAVVSTTFVTLFFYHYILSMYWLIMFKGQSVPHLLLPSGINGNQYAPHDIFLVMFAFLGTISIILGLIKQLNLFIFVVDWERRSPHRSAADGEGVRHPIGSSLNTSGVSAHGTSAQTIGAPFVSSSESGLLVPPPTFGDEANAPDSGISAWRSIFVCNELNDRLSSTRTRWHVTWVAMTVLLEGLGLKNVARWYPGSSTGDEYDAAQFNPFLQFAFGASIWMSLVLAQLLFQWISSIKFGNHLLDFVDACSIANISVVFMDEPFHGFYIHGKAPSRRGEWSHTELAKAMHDEQRGVGFHRGLAPGGCPTFEFYLPPDLAVHVPTAPPRAVHFRQELTRVFADVNSSQRSVASRPGKKETLEDIVEMSRHRCRLQTLIDTMVDHVNRNATQVVQKRSRSDRLWGAPPAGGVAALRQPVFYEDETELAWSACLACGSELRFLGLGIPIGFELHLILLEFTIFSLGWRFGSIYLGVGLTFALNQLVLGLYSFAGRRALAQSTIIKEKFLI